MAAQIDYTFVRYRGELVKVSIREHNIMALRGHLIPVYGQAPMVKCDPCLELRNGMAEKDSGTVPANVPTQK